MTTRSPWQSPCSDRTSSQACRGSKATPSPRPPQPSRGQRSSFEDVSQAAGIDYRYDCGASGRLFLADTMGGGVGLIDYDGDGWLDIYFVNGCAVP